MTDRVAWLRGLLSRTTPGPWKVLEPEDSWHFQVASIICLGTSGSDDLDLAALAPELAEWAAEAAELLDAAVCRGGGMCKYAHQECGCPAARDLLARLDEFRDAVEGEARKEGS